MSSLSQALALRRWPPFPWRLIALLTVCAAVIASAALSDYSAARVLPNVRVAGIDIGGLPQADARARLEIAAATVPSQPVRVRMGERVWTTTNEALGITVDVDAALAAAAQMGREGDLRARLAAWWQAASGGADLSFPRHAGDDRLSAFVSQIAAEVDRAPVEGALVLASEGLQITEPAVGARLDRETLTWRLLSGQDLEARDVTVEVVSVAPTIDADAMAAARVAAAAAYAPFKVVVGDREFAVEHLERAVVIEREALIEGQRLTARVDEAGLAAVVDELAAKVDRAPRNASLRPGGSALQVVPSLDGVALSRPELRAQIAGAIFTASPERRLEAAAQVTPATFTTSAAQQFATKMTLVGSFTSYFPANPARHTNISLAASRFDAQLVQPGESFSFWGRVGDVSYASGFVDAGVIINGRSDTGLAGGICQVSTTFFNAVARAGYQIDERHQHSYYIERYPVGLDAAVLFPSADFRWTNDTGAPVYIRTGSTGTSVTFWVYSLPTGRTAHFPTPVQSNFRDPRPNQPADPAYPKGYIVRGRDVAASRIVYQDGVVIHRNTWYSRYEPVWGGPAQTPPPQ